MFFYNSFFSLAQPAKLLRASVFKVVLTYSEELNRNFAEIKYSLKFKVVTKIRKHLILSKQD